MRVKGREVEAGGEPLAAGGFQRRSSKHLLGENFVTDQADKQDQVFYQAQENWIVRR